MKLRSLRAAAAAVALSAAVVAPLSAVSASAQETPTAARAAAPMVKLTVKVDGCKKGCKLQFFQHLDSNPGAVWQSKVKTTKDGKATFTVPRSRTKGAQLAVDAPWDGALDYQTFTAFAYRGIPTGTKVSLTKARSKSNGTGCWSGTNKATQTLKIAVRKVRVPDISGRTTNGTIAWANPQVGSWGPMTRVHKGVLGAQEIDLCFVP